MTQDAEQIARDVGRRIVELRRGMGLTQASLAEALRVSVERASRIERGSNVTLATMVAVANALGVEVVELLRPPAPDVPEAKRRRGRPRKK